MEVLVIIGIICSLYLAISELKEEGKKFSGYFIFTIFLVFLLVGFRIYS
ncbi:hypothetical protein [Oceanobacillus oncorhynchi]